MERIAEELADLADADLDRIAALMDALTGVLPDGFAAWVRHLAECERDARSGHVYALRPPGEAIADDDLPACIVAAARVRDASIDVAVATLLQAVAEVLSDWLAQRLPPTGCA
jgi:hypothetical protein